MTSVRAIHVFNSALEVGLRATTVLEAAHPEMYSIQRLVVMDYFLVHSDDLTDGPPSLHPRTPSRSGELLVRREIIQKGLDLYRSRGLLERVYTENGVFYRASDDASSFLEALSAEYTTSLRARAEWLVNRFAGTSDDELNEFVRDHVGEWGAEFTMESVLWEGAT